MKSLGLHIIAEFYDCDFKQLCDHAIIEKEMVTAAKKSGATIISSNFHTFNPYGVSGVVVIAESHLTIHTWPEHNFAAVDLFTCGPSIEPWKAFEHLKKILNADKVETQEIPRGCIIPQNNPV